MDVEYGDYLNGVRDGGVGCVDVDYIDGLGLDSYLDLLARFFGVC